jgi:hypothetical protein
VPFITGQTQAKITTINTRACTVWDMMFHENGCHDSPRHRPKGTSISMKSALYYWPFATKFITINVYACSVNETKLQENRPCESLVTGQNVFSPPCKVPFIADQSQPKMQQLTSMRVQCVMWGFRKIAGMTVRIQTKRCLAPYIKLPFLLTSRNQTYISCSCVYSVPYEFSWKSFFLQPK